jgi:hypothetical protein
MANPICRDCQAWYPEEDPDPAPGLCADCYATRLARITPLYLERLNRNDTVVEITLWMATVLEEIGGETPEFARRHAYDLLQAMLATIREAS